MNVPENFYEPEVREGFYVPSEMKRCWAATLEVLEEVTKVCRRHNITFYAEYGTMLGAVRHHGMIPWDDDFDISMKRPDYIRFLKYAREELPEGYVVLSSYTHHEFRNFIGRVTNSNFINFNQEFLRKNHEFPYLAGIDIFPLDFVPPKEEEAEALRSLVKLARAVANVIEPDETDIDNIPEVRDNLIYLFEACGEKPKEGEYVRQQLYIMVDRLMATYKEEECKEIANMDFWVETGDHVYPKEYYAYTINVPFEYFSLPVPLYYDKILQMNYGPNYMTPIKNWDFHEFPIYLKQEKIVVEETNMRFFKRYDYNPDDHADRNIRVKAGDRREVVFLPFKAKYWDTMEPEYWKAINDPDCDVYVIPIPYFHRTPRGECGNVMYDGTGFPEYVNVIGFDAYDFEGRHPDTIYIQNPYDEFDCALTIHPRFYSAVMKAACNELIYVPYFIADDFGEQEGRAVYTSQFYIRVPGVSRADRVIVQSETMRQRYIESLTEWAGEETKAEWENRIQVTEFPINQEDIFTGLTEDEVPDEWWKYLLDENGEGKKVILYYTNVSNIVSYGDRYIEKMKRVLDTFKQNKDKLTIIWHAGYDTEGVLESGFEELWKKYQQVVEQFIADDYGIYEDMIDYSKAVAISDAFYGDRDSIMFDFAKLKKPVMIANIEI